MLHLFKYLPYLKFITILYGTFTTDFEQVKLKFRKPEEFRKARQSQNTDQFSNM